MPDISPTLLVWICGEKIKQVDLKWYEALAVCRLKYGYHDEACGEGLFAAVALLPKTGPVVLLTEELLLSLIEPVKKNTATLRAPAQRKTTVGTMRKITAIVRAPARTTQNNSRNNGSSTRK